MDVKLNGGVVEATQKLVRSHGSSLVWIILGYDAKKNITIVKTNETGTGTIEARWDTFVKELSSENNGEGESRFAVLKLQVSDNTSNTAQSKVVFFAWIGPKVGFMQRSRNGFHKNSLKAALNVTFNWEFHAEEVSELSLATVFKGVGINSSEVKNTTPTQAAPVSKPPKSGEKKAAPKAAPAAAEHHDAPKKHVEAPKHEEHKHQEAHHEAPKHEAPKHEAPKHEAPKHEEHHEAPKHEEHHEEHKHEEAHHEEHKHEEAHHDAHHEAHHEEAHHDEHKEAHEASKEVHHDGHVAPANFDKLFADYIDDGFIDLLELSELFAVYTQLGWYIREDKALTGLISANFEESGGRIVADDFHKYIAFIQKTLNHIKSKSNLLTFDQALEAITESLKDVVSVEHGILKFTVDKYLDFENDDDGLIEPVDALEVAFYLRELHIFFEGLKKDEHGVAVTLAQAATLSDSLKSSDKASALLSSVKTAGNFGQFTQHVIDIRFGKTHDSGIKQSRAAQSVSSDKKEQAPRVRTAGAAAAARHVAPATSASRASGVVQPAAKPAPAATPAAAPARHAPAMKIPEQKQAAIKNARDAKANTEANQAEKQALLKIVEESKSKGTKWEDPNFPPTAASLFPHNPNQAKSITRWRRPEEISPSPQLFVGGVEEGDVQQGGLGDCWFISAISVLASAEGNLVNDVVTEAHPAEGVYQCRFFKNGEWRYVTVDDRIPCNTAGKPFFASCKDENEFWVPIVEKAYAKLHGNYGALEGGDVNEGLVDLTGEASEHIILDDKENSPSPNELWARLLDNVKESYLMGCAIASKEADIEEKTTTGLLKNHAYSIIDAQEHNGVKLLRIRNPWGQYEWNGAWSDNSKEWTDEFKKHFDFEFGNDGTFFMTFDDFLKNYNRVYVLRMMTDDVGLVWNKHPFSGEWSKETSGGCSNFPTWTKNPQFGVHATENTRVFFSLMQPDQRYIQKSSEALYPNGIAAYVIEASDIHYKKTTINTKEIVNKPTFQRGREYSCEFQAEANKNYIIMPAQFNPDKPAPFYLGVFSSHPAEVIAITGEVKETAIQGAWIKGQSAGGCTNHASWKTNVQYSITFSESAEVEIFVEQKQNPPYPNGIVLFKLSEKPTGKTEDLGLIATTSQFINKTRVTLTTTVEKDAFYLAMPCTFDPDLDTTYKIGASSAKNPNLEIKIKPLFK